MAGLRQTATAWLAKWKLKFADNEYQNITEKTFRDKDEDIAATFVDWENLTTNAVRGSLFRVPNIILVDGLPSIDTSLIPPPYRIVGLDVRAVNGTNAIGPAADSIDFRLVADPAGTIDALIDAQLGTTTTVKASWVRARVASTFGQLGGQARENLSLASEFVATDAHAANHNNPHQVTAAQLTDFSSSVLSTSLTGYLKSATNRVLTAGMSILTALGVLEKKIDDNTAAIEPIKRTIIVGYNTGNGSQAAVAVGGFGNNVTGLESAAVGGGSVTISGGDSGSVGGYQLTISGDGCAAMGAGYSHVTGELGFIAGVYNSYNRSKRSAIAGGVSHTLPVGADRCVILGGSGFVAPVVTDVVYASQLSIFSPGKGLTLLSPTTGLTKTLSINDAGALVFDGSAVGGTGPGGGTSPSAATTTTAGIVKIGQNTAIDSNGFLSTSGVYRGAWAANTAFKANDLVLNPTGQLAAAVSDFTSSASYTASNWNIVIAPNADTYATLPYAAQMSLDFAAATVQYVDLTAALTLGASVNIAPGKNKRVLFTNTTSAALAVTLNSSWHRTVSSSISVPAGKSVFLSFEVHRGAAESNVYVGSIPFLT